MWDLSSLTKDRTCASALEAWSLNHWTTREVLKNSNSLAQQCRASDLSPAYLSCVHFVFGFSYMLFFELETPLCLLVPLPDFFFFFFACLHFSKPRHCLIIHGSLPSLCECSVLPSSGRWLGGHCNVLLDPLQWRTYPSCWECCRQSSAFCYHGRLASVEESSPA